MATKQIKLSLPTRIRFRSATAPVTVTVEGTDRNKPFVGDAPTFVASTVGGSYEGCLIADELGPHTLIVKDATSVIYELDFEVVRATDREVELGCSNPNSGPFLHFPDLLYPSGNAPATSGGSGAGVNRYYFSSGRNNIAMRSEIGLVDLYTSTAAWNSAALLEVFVFTGYWTDELNQKYKIRSISTNLQGDSPYKGATLITGWNTFKLDQMLHAEPGDFIGVVTKSTSSIGAMWHYRTSATYASVSQGYSAIGEADLDFAERTATTWGTDGRMMLIRPHLERPWFAISGHSFWAGSGQPEATETMYDTVGSPTEKYHPEFDPAKYLSDILDAPVLNLAVGGASIDTYRGAGGLIETTIDGIRPAVIFHDSVYNDTGRGTDSLIGEIDQIQKQHAQRGVRLCLFEAPGSAAALANPTANGEGLLQWQAIHRQNAALRLWSQISGTPYVGGVYYRVGQYDAAGGDLAYRPTQSTSTDGMVTHAETGATPVHLSYAGRRVAMMAIADFIRSGMPIMDSNLSEIYAFDNLTMPNALPDYENSVVEAGQIGTDVTAILADTADMQPKIGTPATDLAADIAAVPNTTEIKRTRIYGGSILQVPASGIFTGQISINLEIRDSAGALVNADALPTVSWASIDGSTIYGTAQSVLNPSTGIYNVLRSGSAETIGDTDILVTFDWQLGGIAQQATHVYRQSNHDTKSIGDDVDAVVAVLPSAGANMAGEGAIAKNLDQVTVGTTQPRYNKKAGRAFRLQLSARNDGTHKATKPIRVRPGTVGSIAVSVDMSPVFGDEHVQTVGTPVVSSGTITASALGPRDNKAMIQLAGTAVANETPTITVPVTMDTGEVVSVVIDVIAFAD